MENKLEGEFRKSDMIIGYTNAALFEDKIIFYPPYLITPFTMADLDSSELLLYNPTTSELVDSFLVDLDSVTKTITVDGTMLSITFPGF